MSNKSSLNEFCQKAHFEYPKYVSEKVGDVYLSRVTVNGEEFKSLEGHWKDTPPRRMPSKMWPRWC